MHFRNTTPADQEQITHFLREVFNAESHAPFLEPRHMAWKYWAERSDWPGSRSFLLAEDRRIVAHLCAWPFRVMWNGKIISGFHPIDWAARPEVRGSGTQLLRRVRELTDISFSIGGTEASRKAFVKAGDRPSGEVKFFARPLRPWLQARTHQRRNWKLPARLARNWLWNTRPARRAITGWTAERVEAQEIPARLLPASNNHVTAGVRSAELFRYYEQCPVAHLELNLVKQHGEPKGYFLLSLVPRQARVADAWVSSGLAQEWEALYRLAAAAALEKSDVAEITAASALPDGQAALAQAGFRPYEALPIMLFDPNNSLTGAPPMHFQLIDNDSSFLHQGRPDYVL